MQRVDCARSFALERAGSRRLARIAIIAMTTSNSMSVNARSEDEGSSAFLTVAGLLAARNDSGGDINGSLAGSAALRIVLKIRAPAALSSVWRALRPWGEVLLGERGAEPQFPRPNGQPDLAWSSPGV